MVETGWVEPSTVGESGTVVVSVVNAGGTVDLVVEGATVEPLEASGTSGTSEGLSVMV